MAASDHEAKSAVQAYWDAESCGEVYATGASADERYESHRRARYSLEPYILEFADFASGRGRDVLEIGVGMGADHLEWARCEPRSLTGIDLTPRAVSHARLRLSRSKRVSRLLVGDAERLPFRDASYDLVYSWGVLHHTPDPEAAVREVHRILRPGGEARIMIYHDRSIVGALLWLRYALLAGRPWVSLAEVYAHRLESPGTKAYSVEQARRMFACFASCEVRAHLSFGDLLMGEVGRRHTGVLLSLARAIWPRALIRRTLNDYGLMLLIKATK